MSKEKKPKNIKPKPKKKKAKKKKDYPLVLVEDIDKGGRPSPYKEEYNELVYKFALLGKTDIEIADYFDISERTLNRWKLKYPEFCQCLKDGKDIADAEIANSFFNKAKGFTVDEEKIYYNSITDSVRRVRTKKYYPPDTRACEVWLEFRTRNKENAIRKYRASEPEKPLTKEQDKEITEIEESMTPAEASKIYNEMIRSEKDMK